MGMLQGIVQNPRDSLEGPLPTYCVPACWAHLVCVHSTLGTCYIGNMAARDFMRSLSRGPHLLVLSLAKASPYNSQVAKYRVFRLLKLGIGIMVLR